MTIPASSIVSTAITTNALFPPRGNFSILNVITAETGVITAVERIRFYSSIEEVADDWASSTEAYKVANTYFGQSPRPSSIAISFRDDAGGETITEALDAIQDVNPNWYGFIFTNEVRDLAVINGAASPACVEAAAWAQARTKVFANITNSADALNPAVSTDIGSLLSAADYTRTFTDYSSSVDQYISASVMGKAFTVDFSSTNAVITLKFKTLPGITPEDLTSTQLTALQGKRINAYYSVGNDADAVAIYGESYMGGSFFFDEIHGIDWLLNAIENQVFGYLYSRATRVPLTDKGSASLEQQVVKVLDEAVTNGLVAPGETSEGVFLSRGYITSVKPVADLSSADRAQRAAGPIEFTALFAGATHSITIRGHVER